MIRSMLRSIPLVVALCVAWLLVVPVLAVRSNHPTHPTDPASLVLDAPATALVGTAVAVRVQAPGIADDTAVHLVTMGSAGTRVYRTTTTSERAYFTLPATDTRYAGVLRLVATVGEQQATTTLKLLPGAPVDPLVPLVGPRSITANGKDRSMIIALPTDRYGNPTATDTPVRIRVFQPGDSFTTQMVHTANLLAWSWIESGTHAGRTTVVVTAEGSSGPAATLEEIAGQPAPFALAATPATLPADGRQLVMLRTDTLRDQHGNILPDGIRVTFVVESPDGGRRTIPSQILDGVAEAPLQAPDTPGRLKVWTTLYGVESTPIHIPFTSGPAVGTIPLMAKVDTASGELRLKVGPLLGAYGQYVPDGTPVDIHLIDAAGDQQHVRGVADYGYAIVVMRLAVLAPGHSTIQATAGSGYGETRIHIP